MMKGPKRENLIPPLPKMIIANREFIPGENLLIVSQLWGGRREVQGQSQGAVGPAASASRDSLLEMKHLGPCPHHWPPESESAFS